MIYNRFRINIVVRVVLIGFVAFGLAAVLFTTDWFFTPILAGLSLIGLCFELIWFMERTSRELSSFFNSIEFGDFAQAFPVSKKDGTYALLHEAFNRILEKFRELRAEKESHYLYLQTVVEHVGVALVCMDREGKVVLMNQAAQQLLHKPFMDNIEALERVDPKLLETIEQLQSGQKELVKTIVKGELLQIAVHATEFRLQEEYFKLVSFQNIRTELEGKEVEAWQKLIRVLTHEIMNSVTPVISLTEVANSTLAYDSGRTKTLSEISPDDLQDLHDSMQIIERRSKGLLSFVHAYRSLTRLPKPKFHEIDVATLLRGIGTLMQAQLMKSGVSLHVYEPEDSLSIHADIEMIEQVLINLVKNALEAVDHKLDGLVVIEAFQAKGNKVVIQVRDNGTGIDEEFQDKIFVPFFTTKKTGSGIGLSLSRQIMRVHKGSISVATTPGQGTVFTLEF